MVNEVPRQVEDLEAAPLGNGLLVLLTVDRIRVHEMFGGIGGHQEEPARFTGRRDPSPVSSDGVWERLLLGHQRLGVRLVLPYVVLLLISPLLLGCGGEKEIEELLSSGPTVFDITSNSARIVAVSRQPIVCVVAYGPTIGYGLMSTDTDMEEGGHTDHHHVLLTLQPDTEYHFRFSAIGPSGEGYRSSDYRFRTLSGDAGVGQQKSGM